MDHLERRGVRGAAIIEFVIVSALFIFLVFGIMEMGFMFSNSTTVNMAAQQGVRAAALAQTSTVVTSVIAQGVSPLRNATLTASTTNPAYVTVQYATSTDGATWVAWTPGTVPPGGVDAQVSVTVSYRYVYITGSLLTGIGSLLGGGGPSTADHWLTRRAVMRYGG